MRSFEKNVKKSENFVKNVMNIFQKFYPHFVKNIAKT